MLVYPVQSRAVAIRCGLVSPVVSGAWDCGSFVSRWRENVDEMRRLRALVNLLEVPCRREVHTHDGVAGFEHREEHALVRLRA